ncbi:MAG: hypothetical protein NTZ35_04790 [Ignavibacteriales bacterium]|nr:hypothetical protein [Ignavibacteriales bacterium]
MAVKEPWNDEFPATIEFLDAAGVFLNAMADFLNCRVGDENI